MKKKVRALTSITSIISWLRRKRKEESILPEGYERCAKCGQPFPADELFEDLQRKSKHGQKLCEKCLDEEHGIPID